MLAQGFATNYTNSTNDHISSAVIREIGAIRGYARSARQIDSAGWGRYCWRFACTTQT